MIKLAPEVIAMYRDFVEHDSAYELLADAYLAKEDKAAATKALVEYSKPAAAARRRSRSSRSFRKKPASRRCAEDSRTVDVYLPDGGRTTPQARGSLYLRRIFWTAQFANIRLWSRRNRTIKRPPTSTSPVRSRARNGWTTPRSICCSLLKRRPGTNRRRSSCSNLSR